MDALRKAVLERKRDAGKDGASEKKARHEESEEEESSSSEGEESDKDSTPEVAVETTEPPETSKDDVRMEWDAARKLQEEALEGTSEKFVLEWLEKTLFGWLQELEAKYEGRFQTLQERAIKHIPNQCFMQIQPLLDALRTKSLDKAILAHLEAIVKECEAREYRQAFDRYIQLTIGNAPWPIGVTMVGIHARSGREKISESKVAHIMKDEVARGYLTSVKRLMTRCQDVNPPSAPSKRMN